MTDSGTLRSAKLKGIKRLTDQVQEWRAEIANPRRRIPLGFKSVDQVVRGPAAGEVFTFVARSHVGKSMVATNIIANNPDEAIIFFSLEMPTHQVLHRLAAHVFSIHAADLEEFETELRLPEFIDELPARLPYTAIVDDANLGFDEMSAYLSDYETFYGMRPRLAIIDYLEEIAGGKASAEGWLRAEASASMAKAWAKEERMALVLLHQTNRQVQPWEPPTFNSSKGAGYTEADVMIGLWRPGWEPGLNSRVAQEREGWMAMNVIKNRVRGIKHEGMLYRLDPALRLVEHNAWRMQAVMQEYQPT